MRKLREMRGYFTKGELALWAVSVLLIAVPYGIFGGGVLSLVASLLGVTALIFNAKGNPIGQGLMVVFSVLYGIIAYTFSYYGEMITYLGMSGPMAVLALISWLRNPYNGNRAEVEVASLKRGEVGFMLALTAGVTVLFYFILDLFHTANLLPSTLSVTTSFMAVYLTFRRSAYFALAYAANDLVLMVLWAFVTYRDFSYLSVLICFGAFLLNDLYGFLNWMRMKKRQGEIDGKPAGKLTGSRQEN